MNEPTQLTVQDVRCFGGEQTGAVRPITLLVGENSTGKSTFLACYRVLSQVFSSAHDPLFELEESPDFNEEPFFMGSFRDIVRSRRGRQGRVDEFRIATSFLGQGGNPLGLSIAFSEMGSQPTVSAIRWSFPGNGFLEVYPAEPGTKWRTPTDEIDSDLPIQVLPYADSSHVVGPEPDAIGRYIGEFLEKRQEHVEFSQVLPVFPLVVPVAPLRSKPKRTYDPVREVATSDGEHVPMLMMRLDRTSGDDWSELRQGLVRFGRESGLFSDIRVKQLGRQMGDPFQLRVKVRTGPQANIMDVGYGVGQSLPILVDIFAAEHLDGPEPFHRRGPHAFLLQQPEVHLHPRGQAELASLFVRSFQQTGNRFLIETHSDYIMDRVRILVRKKEIKAEDVSILYFEPTRNGVCIHSLNVDGDGNLLDVPRGFREFFDIETDRLLGLRD